MPSDLEIARSVRLRPIAEIAERAGIPASALLPYGRHKAKIDFAFIDAARQRPPGALVLVTGITPTAAGEGKTTTTIGLGDALNAAGRRTMICLREPSLGPCFGVKGGATGGGWAQVAPMDEINLHFTGDFHAITSANNLLAALLDNHLQWGNRLGIDPRRITWRRCLDMNDRALRSIVAGLGGTANGVPREDGFDITVASEVMAVFCLARDLDDLQARLGRIVVGARGDGSLVTAAELDAVGAMAALLRDALMPNLVQTLAGTPALVHGGPFANIAHGCNSVMATRLGLGLADVVVTEAGFGADLGGEKFLDIKCRLAGLRPGCTVVVATVRALKMHGGVAKSALDRSDTAAVSRGVANLRRHVENMGKFGLPVVVALNRFTTDTDAEIAAVQAAMAELGVATVLCTHWSDGAAGAADLAAEVAARARRGWRGVPPALSRCPAARRKDRRRRARNLSRVGGDDPAGGAAQARVLGKGRFRQRAGLHRENPVQLQRRSHPARRARPLRLPGPRRAAVGGRGIRRRAGRRHPHHAGPAARAGRRRASAWTPAAKSPACSERRQRS